MHVDDDDRRVLLGYPAAPTLDSEAVARYALGDIRDEDLRTRQWDKSWLVMESL